jgi:hypothetical protein
MTLRQKRTHAFGHVASRQQRSYNYVSTQAPFNILLRYILVLEVCHTHC